MYFEDINREEVKGIIQAFEDFKNESDYIDFRELEDYLEEIIEQIDYTDSEELKEFFEENLVIE